MTKTSDSSKVPFHLVEFNSIFRRSLTGCVERNTNIKVNYEGEKIENNLNLI